MRPSGSLVQWPCQEEAFLFGQWLSQNSGSAGKTDMSPGNDGYCTAEETELKEKKNSCRSSTTSRPEAAGRVSLLTFRQGAARRVSLFRA
jgi:hypothetical protein